LKLMYKGCLRRADFFKCVYKECPRRADFLKLMYKGWAAAGRKIFGFRKLENTL
jgi:hypothetical protein